MNAIGVKIYKEIKAKGLEEECVSHPIIFKNANDESIKMNFSFSSFHWFLFENE